MEAVGSVDMGCRDESGGTQMDGVRRFKVKDRINQLVPKIHLLGILHLLRMLRSH